MALGADRRDRQSDCLRRAVSTRLESRPDCQGLSLCPQARAEGGGRGADEHDLSGLFAALEALAMEEELQRASEQARERLPAPRYFRGMASVPQLGTRDGRER